MLVACTERLSEKIKILFTTPAIVKKNYLNAPFTIMSVDFEGGSVKTVGACLRLVTLCVLSDRKST